MANCKKCCEFTVLHHPAEIYYGKSYKQVLLIGESPHKSWIETGNPFTNKQGEPSPSAKNIQTYLGVLGYSLDDVAVTEIVTCYVEDRQHLTKMMENCSGSILSKVSEAKPLLVVLMGQRTVQEFSRVANLEIEMLSMGKWNECSYIALYHPSPINSNNNKRNLKYLKSLCIVDGFIHLA